MHVWKESSGSLLSNTLSGWRDAPYFWLVLWLWHGFVFIWRVSLLWCSRCLSAIWDKAFDYLFQRVDANGKQLVGFVRLHNEEIVSRCSTNLFNGILSLPTWIFSTVWWIAFTFTSEAKAQEEVWHLHHLQPENCGWRVHSAISSYLQQSSIVLPDAVSRQGFNGKYFYPVVMAVQLFFCAGVKCRERHWYLNMLQTNS